MLKLVKVMNLEEIDKVEADEKGQEVDSRNEVMHVGKSDQSRAGGWSSKSDNSFSWVHECDRKHIQMDRPRCNVAIGAGNYSYS